MTDPSVRDLVDRALLPLRAVDGALHARAVDYVVDGAHPQVLSEVASFGEGPDECLRPACPSFRVDDAWKSRLRRLGVVWVGDSREGEPILELRSPLYRSGAPSAPQWARLGRLLDAVHRTAASPRLVTPEAVPAWLDVLLADVLCSAGIRFNWGPTMAETARITRVRPGWDVDRVVGLLAEDGTGGPDLPAAVFLTAFSDADDPGHYSRRVRSCPLPAVLPGVIDYLADHADALPASLMDGLTAQERRHVLTRMKANPSWAVAGVRLLAVPAVDASRELRREAVELLRGADPTARNAAAAPVLAGAPASRAVELVELLAAEGGDEVLSEAAGANRRLAGLIARVRARRDALVGEGDEEAPIEVPPFIPIDTDVRATPAKVELRAALDREVKRGRAGRARTGADRVTDADLDALVAVADGGGGDLPENLRRLGVWWLIVHAPSLTLAHRVRLTAAEPHPSYESVIHSCIADHVDPRALLDLLTRSGLDAGEVTRRVEKDVFYRFDPRVSWPWFAERPGLLREALGRSDSAARALEIVGAMPRVPAGLLTMVADVAVGDSKVNRPLAQAVLRSHPRVRVLAEQALGERRAEARASAAAWVGSLGREASVPALAAAVRREKKDVVRAALLAALRECGGDLSEFLSPRALGAEAARGLKSRTPASLAAWFDFDSLPAVHWSDGAGGPTGLVDPDIVRWWVVLADRLKDPSGRGIIGLYLSLLEPADAAALAGCVVRAWAEQDARRPDPEESRAHAQTAGRQAYDGAQQWLARCRADKNWASSLEWAETQAAITMEERIAAAYAEHQRTYAGSAMADKGLLAFAAGMDDGELAGLVRAYMRANPGRRAQFDALVRALYANGRDRALQVLLSIARRHKMAGIQATAAALARETASERGWSAEELADRTVPTAGFDGDGLLRLSYGQRDFTGRLTSDFKIEVSDETGRTRKSLPPARAGEDAEVIKAAKKRLSAARKEAKEVLTLQSERLYEAMCASRTWSAPEWRELLAGHPLVGRLVTRLIWTAAPPGGEAAAAEDSGRDATGDAGSAATAGSGVSGEISSAGAILTFRPAEDGALIGADDAVVELDERARVGLAHRAQLADGQAAAWRQHLADYGVEPLFDQLSAVVPRIEKNQKVLTDLQGHMTDSFTLRAAALKRGYKRGEPMDAGFFDTYVKDFAALDLTAVLGFTGACLPEENVSCATTGLSFTHGGHYEVPLTGVPPVLLAECRADYAALAALGPYDPDWKKKAFM